jgi:tetratricopeptide (TPR) repeat protein
MKSWMIQHVKRGFLSIGQRRHQEAAFELKKSLCINTGYLSARINLGALSGEQERRKEAEREYRKILQIMPEDKHIQKRLERIY